MSSAGTSAKVVFRRVGVDDGAAEEVARAAGDGGEALRRAGRRCSFRRRRG